MKGNWFLWKHSSHLNVSLFSILTWRITTKSVLVAVGRVSVTSAGNSLLVQWKLLTSHLRVSLRWLKTVIYSNLLDDFGFERRLWAFSGRRGIHCWVADERARKLSPSSRKAMVNFFEEQNKNLSEILSSNKQSRYQHPFFVRSLEFMKHFFESYVLVQQDIFNSPEAIEKFLSLPGIKGTWKIRLILSILTILLD